MEALLINTDLMSHPSSWASAPAAFKHSLWLRYLCSIGLRLRDGRTGCEQKKGDSREPPSPRSVFTSSV